MKDGAPDIQPGDQFVTPSTPWPPTERPCVNSMVTLQKQLIDDPVATVQKIVKDSPAAAEALGKGVAHDENVHAAALSERWQKPIVAPRTHDTTEAAPKNWNQTLWHGLNEVLDALRALRGDEFTLDAFNSQLLMLLGHSLPEMLKPDPGDDVFAEIDTFLREEKGAPHQ